MLIHEQEDTVANSPVDTLRCELYYLEETLKTKYPYDMTVHLGTGVRGSRRLRYIGGHLSVTWATGDGDGSSGTVDISGMALELLLEVADTVPTLVAELKKVHIQKDQVIKSAIDKLADLRKSL